MFLFCMPISAHLITSLGAKIAITVGRIDEQMQWIKMHNMMTFIIQLLKTLAYESG
jgi:hypothetical protein